jgi:hypothetical protein
LEKYHEEIYEIEIERQRADHGLLARDFGCVRFKIHLLDALRVVCSEAHEYDDADDGDGELKGARPDENVDEGSDHDPNQSHQESAPKRERSDLVV